MSEKKEGWVHYEGLIPEDIFRIVELRKEFELLNTIREQRGFPGYRTGQDPTAGGRLIELGHCTVLNVTTDGGVTSRHLKKYDEVRHLVKRLMEESAWPRDYHGMPMLPDSPSSFEMMQLYRGTTDEDEKAMIFHHILCMYIESLRHMRPLLDILYGKDGWERFWHC